MDTIHKDFFDRNGIDLNTITREVDCRVLTLKDISPILNTSGRSFIGEKKTENISIGDIIGTVDTFFSNAEAHNIFDNLEELFNEKGEGYYARSLGLLALHPDEIISILESSFYAEPIECYKADNGQYLISINGMHRYLVLRIMYLKQLQDIKRNGGSIEVLKKKFMIPVKVSEIDKELAYAAYLIKATQEFESYGYHVTDREKNYDKKEGQNYDERIVIENKRHKTRNLFLSKEEVESFEQEVTSIEREYSEEQECCTGNINISLMNGEKKTFTKKEFLDFARRIVRKPTNYFAMQEIEEYYNENRSFQQFMDRNFDNVFQFRRQAMETEEARYDG